MELYQLKLACSDQHEELRERFKERLRESGIDDLLGHQLQYSIRLASAPRTLLYEEMHKLFSLADECHALRSLRFVSSPELEQECELQLRLRFKTQRVLLGRLRRAEAKTGVDCCGGTLKISKELQRNKRFPCFTVRLDGPWFD